MKQGSPMWETTLKKTQWIEASN